MDDQVRKIDASYEPFPPFSAWAKQSLNLERWERYSAQLDEQRQTISPEVLEQAQDVVRRAAAVDTGAIEGLYETDRGFTFTVATQAAMWRSYVDEQKGEEVRSYIEAQLEAYEYVLDLATGQKPFSEAAIRELHKIICRNQETHPVMTSVGPQQRPLPKGKYKSNPNHVRTRTGETHAYAPVDVTPMEMQRLVSEMRTEDFLDAHPVLQASYVHYAFVLIHPFADGNGRVARALASTFTYRSSAVPLLILNERRDEYLDTLALADKGEPKRFVDFILERTLDSLQLIIESISSVGQPSVTTSFQSLSQLYRTESGYSYQEVDDGVRILVKELKKGLENILETQLDESIKWFVGEYDDSVKDEIPEIAGYRYFLNKRKSSIEPSLSTLGLLKDVSVRKAMYLAIPKDAAANDDILIVNKKEDSILFNVRISELLPKISDMTMIRLSMFCDTQIQTLLADLNDLATEANGDV